LKLKIHQKLVDRLNLDGITPENLSDPEQMAQVKKTAEDVVGNLLLVKQTRVASLLIGSKC